MGKGKDKGQRKRVVTEAQPAASQAKKAAKKQKEDQQKHGSVLVHFKRTQETNTTAAAATSTNAGEDRDNEFAESEIGNSILADEESPLQEEDDVFTFSEEVDAGCADEDPMITANNLDIDEDADVEIDDEPEPENQKQSSKVKRGVHVDFMRAIQDSIKVESAGKTKGLKPNWLLDECHQGTNLMVAEL